MGPQQYLVSSQEEEIPYRQQDHSNTAYPFVADWASMDKTQLSDTHIGWMAGSIHSQHP